MARLNKIFTLVILALLLLTALAHAESPAMHQAIKRLAATKGPFTFAVIGDSRSGDRVYAKVVKQMMLRNPLFVVNVGDVIVHSGDRKHWQHFREISKTIDVPYFLTPGNHDIDDENSKQVWLEEVDRPGDNTYYSFTVGKNLFVVLNSFDPASEFRIINSQLEWLRQTLDSKRYQHQFVFLHHPLFMWKGATHEGEALDRYPADRDRLYDLLARNHVDAVFSGHEHTFKRMTRGGIAFIITGGGGQPLYGRDSFNHGVIVRVDGANIEAKVIDREGLLRDEFMIQPQK